MSTCLTCHEEFTAKRADAKFCSDRCRLLHWRRSQVSPEKLRVQCERCHNWFTPKQPNQPYKFCSNACRQAQYRINRERSLGEYGPFIDGFTMGNASAIEWAVFKVVERFPGKLPNETDLMLAKARMVKGSRTFYLDLPSGQVYFFENKGKLKRWLQVALETGRLNNAMLRSGS